MAAWSCLPAAPLAPPNGPPTGDTDMAKSTEHPESKFHDLFDDLAEEAVDGIVHHEVPPETAIVEVCKAQFAAWTEMFDGQKHKMNNQVLNSLNSHFDRDDERYSALKSSINTDELEEADYVRLSAFVRMTSAVEKKVLRKLQRR